MLSRLLLDPFALPFMRRALIEVLLLGALAGGVGVFVVLRRLAFLADALTHAVFPGVVIGYLVSGQSGIVPGALVFAVLAAVLFTVAAARARVGQDAALAILLTSFFGLGVVLVSRQRSYTADLTTFLFGRVLTVDSAQITQTAVVAVAVGLVLYALRKELLLRTFDQQTAQAMGYRVVLLDLVLNLMIALVVVAAVKAVGTILSIALLVVPAAAARLLSDRLLVVTGLAVLFGMLGGWLGLAASYEASINHGVRLASGATVVLALVVFYLLALGVGPLVRRRWRRGARLPEDVADVDELPAGRLAPGARTGGGVR
ncbi:metal ABC transporter permease [Protofrankia sp. BMG5.30]|uniref:Manganese transporter n=1 Tax=Protofrankia coriariae TaxID=1562887 RepID=A0ABR5F429_9ACTN|nr:manganese transporter [Protofrankia coriariae]ONH34306.1 manganese transporter [Protofrankia sp. BMG5.30]